MTTNELPLTSQLLQYLDVKAYRLVLRTAIQLILLYSPISSEAYELASLGVTERDWKVLGLEALENMNFQVAKKAFHRIKDCRSLLLINEVEVGGQRKNGYRYIHLLLGYESLWKTA
jgi:hypothetical protein